jgi:hypothetical protein
VTKIILVRWVIGSFGVCLCVGLCEGANPKCANAGWLKLFFKMCGGKIFKTLRWVSVGKMVWSVSSYSEIVNEFLSPENLFGSQKSGRFGVRLIVARSSLLITVGATRRQGLLPQNPCSKNLSTNITQFFIRSTTALLLGSLSYVLLFYFY